MMKAMMYTESFQRYDFASFFCYRKKVIDIGCKYGENSLAIRAFAEFYLAVDIKFQLRAAGVIPYFWVKDFTEDVLIENIFDTAVCLEVIEHVENSKAIIKNAARVLHRNGRLILSTPCRDRRCKNHIHSHFTKTQLLDLLTPEFKVECLTKQFDISWMVVCRKK